MIRTVKSFFVSLRASSRFGRASKLRDAGRNAEALATAREALAILRSPDIKRNNPPEASLVSCCTVLVEELASELNQPGAERADIVDTLAHLKRLPESSSTDVRAWIPYLEAKQRGDSASGA